MLGADALFYLTLGAIAGGFINGLAGTGTALFGLGFYLLVLQPVTAVAIVAFMAVISGIQGLWVVRQRIAAQPALVLRYVVPGLFGVPLGVALLQLIDAYALQLAIAILLIVYGGYFSLKAALPAFERNTPWIDASIGFLGGILGGTASVSGAIPAIWLSLRPWPKADIRAVLQSFNVAILATTITLLFLRGAYDNVAIKALLVTIPIGLIASQIGLFVFKRISTNTFRRLLISLTFLMGIGLLIQTLI